MNKWFHFKLTKDTLVAFVSGIVVIVLSLLMIMFDSTSPFDEFMSVLLRDVLMMVVVGFFFVLYYIKVVQKESLETIGITKKRLVPSLIVNVILAICLYFIFAKEGGSIEFTYEKFCAAFYIAVAGVFEMVFIYGFLRYLFEKSFGIIPAILLTSIFYSLHHAGFQPEFTELFFVGMMYVTVVFFTRNIVIIFPFFWGIGAIWDVLVDSAAGESISNTFSLVVAIGVAIAMFIIALWFFNREKKQLNKY